MSHLTRLAVALLVSTTLAACGGKSSASPGDDSQGGNGAGGNGAGGNGAGGKAYAGSAGTGGADACTSFDDDYAALVNVSISNQTNATIYLGEESVTCGTSPLFQVADANGAALITPGNCRSACVSLRKQGQGGCVANCALPSAVALEPQEVLSTTWDGLFLVRAQLPATCVPYETGGNTMVSCDQAKRIEPGSFTFSAHAGSAVDCSQTSGTGTCGACTASPNGGCSTPGSLVTGTIHSTQTTVVLNESYGIYPAPSPPAGSSAGDAAPAPGGSIAQLTVELVFTE